MHYHDCRHLSMITRPPIPISVIALRWRHNGHDSVSNHQPHGCLLNRLFRRRSKKTSKLRVTGLCAGNSPGTGEFPAQMASNAENASIWWRHHGITIFWCVFFSTDILNRCVPETLITVATSALGVVSSTLTVLETTCSDAGNFFSVS